VDFLTSVLTRRPMFFLFPTDDPVPALDFGLDCNSRPQPSGVSRLQRSSASPSTCSRVAGLASVGDLLRQCSITGRGDARRRTTPCRRPVQSRVVRLGKRRNSGAAGDAFWRGEPSTRTCLLDLLAAPSQIHHHEGICPASTSSMVPALPL